MNKVILMGRLTDDPVVRTTPSNKVYATFTLAVSRRGKSDEADFIPCVAWNKMGTFVSMYFKKGMRVSVVGSMRVESYEDKKGIKRKITKVMIDEVYFADSKKDDGNNNDEPIFEIEDDANMFKIDVEEQ